MQTYIFIYTERGREREKWSSEQCYFVYVKQQVAPFKMGKISNYMYLAWSQEKNKAVNTCHSQIHVIANFTPITNVNNKWGDMSSSLTLLPDNIVYCHGYCQYSLHAYFKLNLQNSPRSCTTSNHNWTWAVTSFIFLQIKS